MKGQYPAEKEDVLREIASRLGYPLASARKLFRLDPFNYIINYLPATQSVTTDGSFVVQADSAFVICQTSFVLSSTAHAYVANLSDVPRFAPLLVNLIDSGAGRELSDRAAPINAFYGSGEWPHYWSTPKILKPNSQFTVRIQNLVATDYNVRLVHRGYKIFGRVDLFLEQKGIE